ncbi:uncharacterized protein [Dysidea avara]|uniref:uncharacterized protein n=1 Tax=Dysidea avara TaxID=196820 RepID=UPI00332498E7
MLLLAVVVLFSQIIITVTSCPLATINCTVQYADDVTGTVNTTQYCHVDNCTVKIIKTGDVLDIVYLDDQFIIGCSKTDSIILLRTADSNMGSCTQADTATVTLTEQVLEITLVLLTLLLNTLLIILIIQRRIYTTMAILLLLAATIVSSIFQIAFVVYESLTFFWPTSNAMCIVFVIFITTALHCSALLVLEMFVVIAATFYKSVRNILPKEKTIKEKCRMLLIFLIVAVSISLLVNIARGLLIFSYDDVFITDDGHCFSTSHMLGEVNQAAMHINTATILIILFATASVFILIVVLFCVLSKRNSVKVGEINRKLVKLAVILFGSAGISLIVFFILRFSTDSQYRSVVALVLIVCERICILIILSSVKVETTHQATSNVENNCVISKNV